MAEALAEAANREDPGCCSDELCSATKQRRSSSPLLASLLDKGGADRGAGGECLGTIDDFGEQEIVGSGDPRD